MEKDGEKRNQKKINPYINELQMMMKKRVYVKTQDGHEFEGELLGYASNHLNVVIMTNDEKIIVRNVSFIKQKL